MCLSVWITTLFALSSFARPLLNELKKRASSSYSIIVSAHTDTEFLIEALHSGIDRYIIKPITEDELFEAFYAYFQKIDKKVHKKA